MGAAAPAPPDTAPPTPVLEIEDLRVHIPTRAGLVKAVDGVSFAIMPGEILGVVGESGSGKSVTALSVLRLLEVRRAILGGRILFQGEDVLAMPKDALRRLRGGRAAMVFQDPMTSLNPVLRVGGQIVEGLLAHGNGPPATALATAKRLIGEMGLPEPAVAVRRFPHQFSGGMRQRIMLAMGFGNTPALLIADEPTTALDVTIQAQILALLRRLNADYGTAIMLITHDLGVVASICTRVVMMYAGKVIETGSAEDVLSAPAHPYTQALIDAVPRIDKAIRRDRPAAAPAGPPPVPAGGCCFAARCTHRMAVCASEPPLRAALAAGAAGAGRTVACWLTQPPARLQADPAPAVAGPQAATGHHVVLELRGVTKHFALRSRRLGRQQKLRAVDGVDLSVDQGETLGLVGESGSGKSTLARLIVRLHRPTAGEIIFQGQPIGSADRRALRPLRRDIQMIFQDPYASLNQRMTVGAAIAEPILVHRLASTRAGAMAQATDLLRRVGLGREALERYPHEFSGGQRQRIGIARALAVGPKLIVADEPVSSLDVNIQAQILDLLAELQGSLGLTYVFISHNLAVVRQIADRIAVLYLGKIVEIAAASALFERPMHPYTRSLIAAAPIPDVAIERSRQKPPLLGQAESAPPSGCRFRARCPLAAPLCAEREPPLAELRTGRLVACHFPDAA